MLRRQILFVLLASIALASNALCQPTGVSVSYLPDGGNPPLTCPCVNGSTYPDGAVVYFEQDGNDNGPDSTDVIAGSWTINSEEYGIEPGYWVMDNYLLLDSINHPYYVRINSGGCCWLTHNYTLSPGPNDIILTFADWTCAEHACWMPEVPPIAPANFRASDDSLCMLVACSWEHNGTLVTGFDIFQALDSTLVAQAFPSARSALIRINSVEPRGYYMRTMWGSLSSEASNVDWGSPLAVHFAGDSTGDIRGTQFGGTEFTLRFAPPAALPEQCEITDSLFLLSNGERIALLATAHDTTQISGQFPNPAETLTNCRVVLVASYSANSRDFESTDTTASTFDLAWLSTQDRTAPVPLRTEISGVFPNPFNPDTRIQFTLSAPEAVNLVIYNLAGQKVRTLAAGRYDAGAYSVTWDGKSDAAVPVGTGLYLCRMTTSRTMSTKRLLLLK